MLSHNPGHLDAQTDKLEACILGTAVYSDPEDASVRLTHRLAATTVRRAANQHGCVEASTGVPCVHPDHRRDRAYARFLLDTLDLAHDLVPTTATDRAELVAAIMTPTHAGDQSVNFLAHLY